MPKSARTRILALPLPAVLALPAETALAAKDDTVLVSRASDGTAGNGESLFADVSANGRYVAFHSSADNLSTEDDDAVINVYVRDLVTGTTTLVSRATDGTPADGDSTEPPNETTTLVSRASGALGAPAAADATEPSVSGDGRRVAFHSAASNLVAGDNNPTLDVFVRDLTTATTTVASAATGSSSPAGGVRPAISGDGRHVAFDTTSDDVSDEDRDATVDVYPRDLATGTTMLVSRRSGAAGDPGDANSSHAAIADGAATVAFHSVADTLADDDDNAATNVFARRLVDDPAPPPPPVTAPPVTAPPAGQPEAPAPPSQGMGAGQAPATPGANGLGGTPARDRAGAPAVTALSFSPRTFAVARGSATRIRFALSERASVRIALRRVRGRRSGTVGVLTRRALPAGRATIRFTGRIGRRKLPAGRYRATVVATDAAGTRSRPRTAAFRIVRSR